MTEHAQENLNTFKNLIPRAKVQELISKANKVIHLRGSTACVVYLDQAIKNPIREDWAANDVIAAIVRHGQVVTIMLSRRNQVTKSHMRTDFVA